MGPYFVLPSLCLHITNFASFSPGGMLGGVLGGKTSGGGGGLMGKLGGGGGLMGKLGGGSGGHGGGGHGGGGYPQTAIYQQAAPKKSGGMGMGGGLALGGEFVYFRKSLKLKFSFKRSWCGSSGRCTSRGCT